MEKDGSPAGAKRTPPSETSDSAKRPRKEFAFATEAATNMALRLREVYEEKFRFPAWSIELMVSGGLEDFAKSVVVYHGKDDDMDRVRAVTSEREPVNIAMRRFYDADLLEELTGYRRGAYGKSTKTSLMPNIAIYCQTPLKNGRGHTVPVHVINVIGYAFDAPFQPDAKYFFPMTPEKWTELVKCMSKMWRYVFECAQRKGLKRVYLADVGGGAFATLLNSSPETKYEKLKAESLTPVLKEYPEIEEQKLGMIPEWAFQEEIKPTLKDSLLVNAWDPWSMVGNGNAYDKSLDGFFGRSSAMAILCWPPLNKLIKFESV
eukprot:TRINITY_DN111_c2_g1_i1.p1 TRINITY_DN111_c2_g1~~TRINITY_DN111_c2_g1_i1.p1  ORF type:complete len:319 (-),score=68.37 TRINITY_DN111_c2_g1_i1:189-1145(-)